ncbi:hypothetical protein [Bradyrhizobium betae]|uniref:Uncharacterized protein n=1 Tax=Bradyrhizobium betae TaxID=244734 RepID=A0A5P6PF30_9BRAD|nr:hypothetical protein [Bradyrhizobium betae]MCS3726175.1 hypothetical protein [Bradyrhizobium betae]QFI76748.1 hypothetical protein F8237_32720 [Bradyrhizobium betae]
MNVGTSPEASKTSAWSKVRAVASIKLAIAILTAVIFGYLALIALPVALTSMASGRGITLSGLEIGPEKVCDHVGEIITAAANNNELAVFDSSIGRLLLQMNSALNQVSSQSELAARTSAAQSDQLLALVREAISTQANISQSRQQALDKVTAKCLQRDDPKETFRLPVICLVLGSMAMFLVFAYFVIGTICGSRWPWQPRPMTPLGASGSSAD